MNIRRFFFISLFFSTFTFSALANPDLIAECETNSKGWPGLHWAIWEMERPDIALEILNIFPEEAGAYTPKVAVWYWNTVNDREYIIGYDRGFSALELSIRKGYNDLVLELLKKGANPSEKRKERTNWLSHFWSETTPLYWAIKNDQPETVCTLLQFGASTESIYRSSNPYAHYSAFMFALEKMDDPTILKAILEANNPEQPITDDVVDLFRKYTCDPNGVSGPWPPLHHAFYVGAYDDAEALFVYGANPYKCYHYPVLATDTNEGRPQQLYEIAWGDRRLLNMLIKRELFLEEILLRSIKEGEVETAAHVLETGFFTDQAFKCVLEHNQPEILCLLYAYTNADHLFLEAIERNLLEMTKVIVELGHPDIEAGMKRALKLGHMEIYRYLQASTS